MATCSRCEGLFFEGNYTEYVTLLHGVGGVNRAVSAEEKAIRDQHERLIRRLVQAGSDAGVAGGR